MAGSVYTFVGNANPGSAITSITTSQGVVALNHSGLFLPSEYTGATAAGCILEVGPATTPVGQLSAPTVVAGSTGVLNGTYKYVWTFVTAVGETIASPEATITVSSKYVSVSNAPIGTPTSGVLARKLYRTTAGGGSGSERLVTTLNDNTTTSYTDNTADGSLGAPVPVVDTSAVPGGIPGGGGGGGGGSFLTQAEADARYALIGSGGTSRNLIIGGSLGSTFTLNMSATTDQWLEGTLSANLALTVSGIVAGVSGTMLLTQDATGGRTLTINGTNVPIPNSASAYFTVLLHSADGTDLDVTVPGGAPVPVNAATVGTDGNLGGPGGSPLSAAVAAVSSDYEAGVVKPGPTGLMQFSLSARALTTGFPVPIFKPTGTNNVCAFDIAPSGTTTPQFTGQGFAWMDVCSMDPDAAGDALPTPLAFTSARIGVFSDHVEIGSRGFNGGVGSPVQFCVNTVPVFVLDANGQPTFESGGVGGSGANAGYLNRTINPMNGTGAYTQVSAEGSGGLIQMRFFSPTFSSAPFRSVGQLDAQAAGGLMLSASSSAGPIVFVTGSGAVTRATLDSNGNIFLGNAALATTATAGFVSLPSTPGAPTGAPTLKTGLVPVSIDSTNNKLWAYIGGAWKGVVLS